MFASHQSRLRGKGASTATRSAITAMLHWAGRRMAQWDLAVCRHGLYKYMYNIWGLMSYGKCICLRLFCSEMRSTCCPVSMLLTSNRICHRIESYNESIVYEYIEKIPQKYVKYVCMKGYPKQTQVTAQRAISFKWNRLRRRDYANQVVVHVKPKTDEMGDCRWVAWRRRKSAGMRGHKTLLCCHRLGSLSLLLLLLCYAMQRVSISLNIAEVFGMH